MQTDIDTDTPYTELGLPAMDKSHRALLSQMTALALSTDEELARRYPLLVAAIERDFREEEALMEEAGIDSFQVHLEQHARVLSALHHAASSILAGDTKPGREVLMLFPQWLLFHIATLDKALAEMVQAGRAHAAADTHA